MEDKTLNAKRETPRLLNTVCSRCFVGGGASIIFLSSFLIRKQFQEVQSILGGAITPMLSYLSSNTMISFSFLAPDSLFENTLQLLTI